MSLSKLLANQLGRPSSLLGSLAAILWNRRNAALNDTVLDLLSLQPADRVLEIGFGGGYLLERMNGMLTAGLLAGVDRSPAMVARAQKRFRKEIGSGRIVLQCAAAEALPYPTEVFSVVCSVNSIFYWGDVERGLSEILRVLANGGKAGLCFTSQASLEKKGFARHIHLFAAGALEPRMEAIGFQEVHTAAFSDKYRSYICITAQKAS